jgi:hypothetical protein
MIAGAVLGMLAALGASAPAAAQEKQPDLISFGVGMFDVQKNEPRDKAADFRVEYRFGTSLFPAIEDYVAIRPFVGGEATSDGGLYGLGGLMFDIPLGPLTLTPNFGVGLHHDGGGKELGSVIEFRSSAELSYRFENQSRLGVSFGHISNAGITTLNPGAEIFTVYYHLPSSWLFGY